MSEGIACRGRRSWNPPTSSRCSAWAGRSAWCAWPPGSPGQAFCRGHWRRDISWVLSMDEWTIKTPNPKCRLFFKIDLLTDFAVLCLTDFLDWRYIHSWLVFSTQLVNCCPHGQRNYACVLLPLYLLYDLPPPSQNKCTIYSIYKDNVWLWGLGGVELCCRPYSAGVLLLSVTDQIQNLQNCFPTPNKYDK